MSSKRTKTGQFTAEKNEEVRKAASGMSVEGALKSLVEVQAKIGSTFADVGEQLQAKLQELETVKKAVTLEKEELERIHGAGEILKSIEELQAAEEAKQAELKKANNELVETLQASRLDKEKRFKLELEELKASNQRQAEQWSYDFELTKRNSKAAFDEEMRQARLSEMVRKETLERQWTDREESIKKQETEVAALRKKVEEFPKELEASVNREVGIVSSRLKREKEQEIALLTVQHESKLNIAEANNTALNAQLIEKDKTISGLNAQLATAYKQIQELSGKSVENAAAAQTIAYLKEQQASQNGAPRKA